MSYQRRYDDDLLNRYFATYRRCRARGDRDGMRQAWNDMAAVSHDRFRGFVSVWSFESPGGERVRVRADEIEDVVQQAFVRFMGATMAEDFEGTHVGQIAAAMRTVCWYACHDHARAVLARERHQGESLDAVFADSGEPVADLLAAMEATRRQERAEEALLEGHYVRDLVAQIPNDRQRRAVELRLDGRDTDEIAQEMDVSEQNAYQLISRGLRAMRQTGQEAGS